MAFVGEGSDEPPSQTGVPKSLPSWQRSLASIASVGTSGVQVRFAATAAYVLPVLLLPALGLLTRMDIFGTYAGLGLLLPMTVLLITARRSERSMTEVFRLRYLFDRISSERGEALKLAELKLQRVEEERLLQQEKARVDSMHEILQVRGTFLAKISHELRSPLQSIISALDVFEMRHSDEISEDQELIARMRRSSMLFNAQLRDLLTLARGQAGRLRLRTEPFDACSLVEGVADGVREAAGAKRLKLTAIVPEVPQFVVADGSRVDQVLTNLLTNSIRYTEEGAVEIRLSDYDFERRCICIVVSDTGGGIPKDQIATLFSPDKLIAGSERRGESSGIGLAIVGTLLDHLGGRVSVTSDESIGTTFRLEIPAESMAADDHSPSRSKAGNARVLVIDDLPDVLDALSGVIEELGWHCDRAASAAIGLNLLATHTYRAVFIDIELPFKSGPEIATETRGGAGPNRTTRLIGMSASEATLIHADHPFDATLLKPIDRESLRRALAWAFADEASS